MQKMGCGSGSGVGEKKAPNGETPRAPVGTASMPTATRIHLSATGSGVPTVHCTEVSSLTGGAMSQGLVVPGLSGESSAAQHNGSNEQPSGVYVPPVNQIGATGGGYARWEGLSRSVCSVMAVPCSVFCLHTHI